MMWRLLVDQRFQGRGSGRAAVRSVAEYVRGRLVPSRSKSLLDAAPGPYEPSTSHSASYLPVCHRRRRSRPRRGPRRPLGGRSDHREVLLTEPGEVKAATSPQLRAVAPSPHALLLPRRVADGLASVSLIGCRALRSQHLGGVAAAHTPELPRRPNAYDRDSERDQHEAAPSQKVVHARPFFQIHGSGERMTSAALVWWMGGSVPESSAAATSRAWPFAGSPVLTDHRKRCSAERPANEDKWNEQSPSAAAKTTLRRRTAVGAGRTDGK